MSTEIGYFRKETHYESFTPRRGTGEVYSSLTRPVTNDFLELIGYCTDEPKIVLEKLVSTYAIKCYLGYKYNVNYGFTNISGNIEGLYILEVKEDHVPGCSIAYNLEYLMDRQKKLFDINTLEKLIYNDKYGVFFELLEKASMRDERNEYSREIEDFKTAFENLRDDYLSSPSIELINLLKQYHNKTVKEFEKYMGSWSKDPDYFKSSIEIEKSKIQKQKELIYELMGTLNM